MTVSEFVMSMHSFALDEVMCTVPFINEEFSRAELGEFGEGLMRAKVPDLFKLEILHQSHHLG